MKADLAIVGAGPAGMAAAVEAADAGLKVLVVDEQAQAGGQIFRRPPQPWLGARSFAPYSWATELIQRFEAYENIHCSFRTTAYGVLRDRAVDADNADAEGIALQLALSTPSGGALAQSRRLLIATGAYDMPVAFPGWTKPGVMTVGAVQSLLKSQKLLAGRRIVLAGSHPLLLIAAEQLLDAGAEIEEVAFARGLPTVAELAGVLPAIPGHMGVFVEASRALAKLMARRVRMSTRTVASEAVGGATVSKVLLRKVNAHWEPSGEPREVETDLLVLGYGFSPSTELARQSGCEMKWDSKLGGWIVSHDDRFETSAEGVYVAGEPGGVAGAEASRAQGRIAGLHIAQSLGASVPQSKLGEAQAQLHRADRFSRVVQSMFEPHRQSLAELSRPAGTTVCRCELVPTDRIDDVLESNPFISTASAVKLECRSGMGACQGRYCEATVAARVAAARGISIEQAGLFTAHLPVKPVPIESYRGLVDG